MNANQPAAQNNFAIDTNSNITKQMQSIAVNSGGNANYVRVVSHSNISNNSAGGDELGKLCANLEKNQETVPVGQGSSSLN